MGQWQGREGVGRVKDSSQEDPGENDAVVPEIGSQKGARLGQTADVFAVTKSWRIGGHISSANQRGRCGITAHWNTLPLPAAPPHPGEKSKS